MGTVTDYLETLTGPNRETLTRVVAIARELAPEAVEGMSYAMPALLIDGKGLLSALETKKHLAIYPFSGQVLPQLADELEGFDWAAGTLRFSADHPVPDGLVRRIVELRLAEIEAKTRRR
ncbi:DUF1801 domain-containing protein [Sinomonas sp. JGH33]|uniref:DUF1801 domain-containing protein n=1 Tax=Sinomonas terricola TaxID=3110330 RepID=A0ABU5T3J8_9MICC|nr:DUF1801 domain-containing protein [Sinomonas sp. JGH33]MEA5454079.1 DUF1801 domain-containing protein [Sinomonas sp. JGH33]